VQFISVSLTKELKEDLREWAEQYGATLIDALGRAVSGGYRVSVKEEEVGFVASMSAVRDGHVNKGLVLAERGSTPQRALLRLLWAHTKHFQLVWPRERGSEEEDW